MSHVDEMVEEAQRLIDEARAAGRRVMMRQIKRSVVIAVGGLTHEGYAVTYVGRGRSMLDAMIWLGAWEAW